ncbi:DUF2950 family protein [Sulfitobacter sp. LCG007]
MRLHVTAPSTRPFVTLALCALFAQPGGAAEAPAVYPTPQDAVEALADGLEAQDRDAVIAVFGSDALDVISSGSDPRDRLVWGRFLELYRNGYSFEPVDDSTIELLVGEDDWPMPIPLVKGAEGWFFDAAAGREEILARRIGFNELSVMEILEAYVDLQLEYRMVDHDGDGIMEFAWHILSTEDAREGLYWPGDESPLGDLMARASAEGYEVDGDEESPQPFYGYLFHIFNAQGPSAKGGERDYMIDGDQVVSHAMIAVPAQYGETGVMSFMIAENGILLEADLGADEGTVTAALQAFDPDERWTVVEDRGSGE